MASPLLDHLQKEFAARSRKNARYSLRAFAKSLGMHPATLSALLNRRRPLTLRTAAHLVEALPLDLDRKRDLLLATVNAPPADVHDPHVLTRETFEVISSWEYDATLCLLQLPGKNGSIYSIASRLGIGTGRALECLRRLERLGLVRKTRGRWEVVHLQLETSGEASGEALRRVHRQYLRKALEALDTMAPSEREVSGTTMAIDARKLPEARRRIRRFRQELTRFLEGGEKNAVFRLGVQLYPLAFRHNGGDTAARAANQEE
jgi:transcriptional regulator with XRE-family HTH domain